MMSISAKFRSAVLSGLLGLMVFGFLSSVCVVLTPATAGAQEEKPNEDPNKPDETKTKVNPFVHFFVSIGIAFGLIFAIISIGMVALIIILLLDLRLGESVPPSFVEEFTEMLMFRVPPSQIKAGPFEPSLVSSQKERQEAAH